MRLAPVLLVAALLAGCGSDVASHGPQPGGIVVSDPNPGRAVPPPRQLVFQVFTGGGFVPAEYHAAERPTLSVYGDGTAYVVADTGTRAPGRPVELLRGRVSRHDLLDLLARASRTGLFDGTKRDLGDPHITDMPSTVVTFRPGSAPARMVSAYALNVPGGDDDLPAARRAGRRALRSVIKAFDEAVVRANANRYTPDRIDVTELTTAVRPSGTRTWPGPALTRVLHDTPQGRCGVVSGTAARRVYRAALAAGTLNWRDGSAGHFLVIRALLPAEAGCTR